MIHKNVVSPPAELQIAPKRLHHYYRLLHFHQEEIYVQGIPTPSSPHLLIRRRGRALVPHHRRGFNRSNRREVFDDLFLPSALSPSPQTAVDSAGPQSSSTNAQRETHLLLIILQPPRPKEVFATYIVSIQPLTSRSHDLRHRMHDRWAHHQRRAAVTVDVRDACRGCGGPHRLGGPGRSHFHSGGHGVGTGGGGG